MKYIEHIVKNMKISREITDKTVLISGARNYFGLHFTFDEEFSGLNGIKAVEFFKNRNKERIDLVDGYCAIPNWVLRDKSPFEIRIVSGTEIGTPWFIISLTEGGTIEADVSEEIVPEGTEYVKTVSGNKTIAMLRKNNNAIEYSQDGITWSAISNNNTANSEISTEEMSRTNIVGVYDTSTFIGETFSVTPSSEAFVASRNFLRFESAGQTGNTTPLVEGETISLYGVDITLNKDGSLAINGTSTATFYINSNITDEFRTAIIGQTVKISYFKSDDSVALAYNSGLAFNDAAYGYNLTKTGSYIGVVTAEMLSGKSRLTITSGTTFDNVTVSSMLELQSDNGYLSEYTKSDCEIITENAEYIIANYPTIAVVGEHTIKYQIKGGNEAVNADEIAKLKALNPLYGKKVTCLGDSLCYGQGFTGGYCTILSELEPDTTFVNKGVGGSQISSNHASGGNWHIENQLSGVAEDTDYIVCEGYINDYLTDCELGTITDGYEAELDTSTFYGGMESLCKVLANNYTNKRYGFIIAHSHYSADSAYDNNLYITAIKKCCNKWGVPYLDLSTAITPIVPIYKSTYYTDGLHYNEAGYRRIAPAIREWIKTL